VLAPRTRERLEALAAQGGMIVYGDATDAVKGLLPQVAAEDGGPLPESTVRDLMWYHRREGMRDLYFMAAETNGFNGTVSVLTANGAYKVLSLDLTPSETACITIDRNGVTGLPTASLQGRTIDLSSGWTLAFPARWGAPASLPLNALCAWKDMRDVSDECRAFSGTAVYTRTVEVSGTCSGRAVLDLGNVFHAARVFVNGREVAALWSSPYRCDIAPFLREGMNDLRIEVASTWHNRLAYDAARPMSERKTWTVWNAGPRTPLCLKPGAKLKPSGLLGPVKLVMEVKGE
jgi:hypothetical protein